MQKKAREALAERFCRFSANTLKGYLQSDNPDVRRAAVVAAEAREETELIPDLIASLNDSNEMVWRAARAALKGLSGGKDFGPPPGATEEERKMAIAAWTAWHKKK
jgi:HEAT repeat protein